MDLPKWLSAVPTDPAANVAWRIALSRLAADSLEVQQVVRQAIEEDVLFFFASMCWLLEPRATVKTIPFIPWVHQSPVIQRMDQAITDAEQSKLPMALTLKKSRAQGATYMYIAVLGRRFILDSMFSAGLVTRNEKLVDSSSDKDAILWKVAWLLDQLPRWLLPGGYVRNLSDHTILNPANGSLFTGYSATGDVARGGRMTCFAVDEFGSDEFIAGGKDYRVLSSLSSVTNCIFLVSTFGGEGGAFHEAATDPENPLLLSLDWKDNPTQTKNAYVMRQGILMAVNPDEQPGVTQYARKNAAKLKKIDRRGHTMEGKVRSPWYDAYCLLPGATPRFIARELDMNPRGAVGKVFETEILDKMKELCRSPVWEGDLILDPDTLKMRALKREKGGPLRLWFEPSLDEKRAPAGFYAIGCDISGGGTSTSASNSNACCVNRQTGEQVLEYTVRGKLATTFARYAVAIAIWMENAYLGWECTGPTGSQFTKVVTEDLRYGNIYSRESGAPGWWNHCDADKVELFEGLCVAFMEDEFIPRSEDLIRECGEWEIGSDGKIVHRPSKVAGLDEKAHGDRCIGAGVCHMLMQDRPMRGENTLDKHGNAVQAMDAPYGSFAWRQQEVERLDRQREEDGGGEFSLSDLLGIGREHNAG